MCEAAAASSVALAVAAVAAPQPAPAPDAQRPVETANDTPAKIAPQPSAPLAPLAPLALVKPAEPAPPHANSNGTGDSPPPPPPPRSSAPDPLDLPASVPEKKAIANDAPIVAPSNPTPNEIQEKPVETPKVEPAPEPGPKVNGSEAIPPIAAPPAPTVAASVPEAAPQPAENGVAEAKEEAKPEPEPTKPAPAGSPPAAPAPKKTEIKPKSTLKLATVTPALSRKRKIETKPSPKAAKKDGPSPPKKAAISSEGESVEEDGAGEATDDGDGAAGSTTSDGRAGKRNRTKVQPYQSPAPELATIAKLSTSRGRSTPTKQNDDKLIVFYKNEFLAVRNAEGSFYVCQTMQNVYRTSRKIKIRWLSQDKTDDPSGEIYKPDFYDITDIECVLTTLSLQRSGSGLKLGASELARTQSILGRALAAERGEPAPDTSVTEEHPDGLDLSLYKDESQLEKKKHRGGARKRAYSKSSPRNSKNDDSLTDSVKSSPRKRSSLAAKKRKTKSQSKSSKPLSKSKSPRKVPAARDKQTSNNSLPPISAPTTNKTATPGKVLPKGVMKKSITPNKSSNKNSPTRQKKSISKVAAAAKAAQIVSTPSTSTGKTTRTPRKPPSKK